MSKREQNKQVNRAAILEAAKMVFAIKGIESSNVTEIIKKSGLAAGTFYKYFDNKNSLYEEISNEMADDIAAVIDKSWAAEKKPEDYIESVICELDLYFRKDPAALGFLLRNYDTLSDSFSSSDGWRLVKTRLVEHLREARDMGLLVSHDPELMTKVLMASTAAVLSHIEGECKTFDEKHDALKFLKFFLVNSLRVGSPM